MTGGTVGSRTWRISDPGTLADNDKKRRAVRPSQAADFAIRVPRRQTLIRKADLPRTRGDRQTAPHREAGRQQVRTLQVHGLKTGSWRPESTGWPEPEVAYLDTFKKIFLHEPSFGCDIRCPPRSLRRIQTEG